MRPIGASLAKFFAGETPTARVNPWDITELAVEQGNDLPLRSLSRTTARFVEIARYLGTSHMTPSLSRSRVLYEAAYTLGLSPGRYMPSLMARF